MSADQMALFDVPEDPPRPLLMPADPANPESVRTIDGYMKWSDKRDYGEVATLQHIAGDGFQYRPAIFGLAPELTIETWGKGNPCAYHEGRKMPFYEAFEKGLAWEIKR